MTPLPPVPNTAIVRAFLEQAGHLSQVVTHWEWTGGVSAPADMLALCQNMDAAFEGLMDGSETGAVTYISSDTVYMGSSAVDLSASDAPQAATYPLATPHPGAATQKSLNNSAFLVSLPVGTRFRGGHGRSYIPGLTGDNSADGRTWIAGAVTDIGNWYYVRLRGNNTSPGTPVPFPNITGVRQVIVSYYNRALNPVKPYRRTTPLIYPVLAWRADTVIRSQRRRVRESPTPS